MPRTPRASPSRSRWSRSSAGSLRLEAKRAELIDCARRDDEAVDARRVEDETQRGFGHWLAASVGGVPQLLDLREALHGRITGADFGRLGGAAAGRRRCSSAVLAGEE